MPSLTRPLFLDGPLSFDAEANFQVGFWLGDPSALLLTATIATEDGGEIVLNRPWLVKAFGEDRIRRVEADALEAWRDTGMADWIAARSEQSAWNVGVA